MRTFLLTILIIVSAFFSYAQEWEIGLAGGASGYIGDLNTYRPLKFTDPAFGFFGKYNYNPFSSLELGVTVAGIRAADADSRYKEHQLRNLSFRSPVTELSFAYEFNFLKFIYKDPEYRFTPYVTGGLALFSFDPKAEYQGTSYRLQPLGTEGQGTAENSRKKYSLFGAGILYGAGIKYNFASNFTFGMELAYRYVFTDYLDDVGGVYADNDVIEAENGSVAAALADRSGEVNDGVNVGTRLSQRGDSRAADQYMTGMITLSYTFTPIKCPTFR